MKGKMNKNSIILAVIVGVLVVTTLCTGLVVANRRQPVITLSDSAIEMDVTDTYALETEIENPRKDVVWKSADESVATVTDKGVVTALKEGKTEVTVTSGKTTASCAVSVTDSQSAPRIELDYNNVAIGLDYSFTVTPKMMWKGKEVKEDIAYTWALDEGAEDGIASIEQKGNSATITGLKYGETAFTVSTTYRDTVLVKKIKVCVTDIDVMFDSPNMEMSAGCFRVNLGLVATEKDVTSIVPEIRVYDKEELVANPTFTWSNSDESIAVRDSKTGRISAKKAGETEITGLYKDSKLLIRVNVYRPEITINPLYVEAIKNYVISSDKWSGMKVESVTFSGKEVMKATHKSGKNIQLDEEKLPAVGTSGTLIIQTEKVKYVADSMVVTMAISNESDLNKMASVIKSNKGAGYYALTNDITCKGTYDSGLDVEFIGTFDGCGYNIANMTTADKESSTRGLLGKSLGQEGVVKNVSFTNAKHGGQGAFIVTNAAGRIENVYIQIDITDCTALAWDSATAVLTCNTFGVFQTKSVIVEYMNALPTDATTGYPLWQLHYGYAKHQGLFAIGTDKVAASENDLGAGLKDIYAAYVNYGEFSDAGNDMSTWDESFWTMTNGIPYPKNLGTRKGTVPKVSLPQYVGTGSTVSIDGLTVCDKVIVNSTMKKYGITVKNGALVIPKTVPSGLTLSITVQSAFDASKKTTIQTTVLASEAVSMSDVCAVELYNVKKFEVDLSSKANVLKGATLTDLTIDGKAVTGVTYRDNKITMDASVLGDLGEKTMIAYFKSNSKLYIVTVTVDACTYAIRTEADLNKLGDAIDKNNGDGRYVLAADIVCKGTYDSNTTVEFNGIFDGHGYAIYNMTTSDRTGTNRGLIGKSLGSNGVVKNISFLNAKHSGQGAFIATAAAGKMENLYIQISVTDCTVDSYDGATSVLASSTFGVFNTNNILVEYSDTLPDGAKSGYAVWQLHYGYAKHQNLYVVGEKKVATTENDLGAGLKDIYGAYTNYGEYIKAGNSTDTWDSSFWGFTNGVPYPKHLGTRAGEVPNVTMSQYTGAGEKLELVGLTICDNAVLDAATQKLGVTLKNSTITIPKNVPLGSTIRVTVSSAFDSAKAKVLTAKVMTSKSVTLDDVYFAEKYDKTTFAIDLGNKASSVAGKQVISATLESKAFKTVSYNNGVVTLDTNSLSGLGEKTVTLLFMGQNELVTVTAKIDVCTMAIRSEDDLNRMGSVIMENNGAGRYVLANDITCTGTYNSNVTVGFTGTFDGRGYVIYNMTTATGETSNRGLLGKALDSAGVLQNVSFVNAKHSGNGGFIAQDAAGLIQDVYIQISLSDITNSTTVLATSTFGVFQNKHVVVEYKDALPAGTAGGYAIGQLYYGYAKHQGLYIVGADKVAATATDLGGPLQDIYQAFMTYGEFADAKVSTSDWGSFWKVTNGIPYPARLTPDTTKPSVSIPEIIAPGSTTAIEGATIMNQIVLSKELTDKGIKVEDNKLVVPSNLKAGTEIKMTVRNAFDTSKAVTLTTKVLASKSVDVKERQDIAIYDKQTVAISLKSVKDEIGDATLFRATLDGEAFTTSSYTDGVLTVDTATLKTLGNNTVVATFRSDSKLITVTIPLDVCTMIIKTEGDLNNMPKAIKAMNGEGRYVLVNNIVCESEYDNGGLTTTFVGTFDGRGYAIYNFTTATANESTAGGRGLFGERFGQGGGITSTAGVLKNVAFINAKHGGTGSMIADINGGLIENVYVQVDITSYNTSGYQWATSVLASEAMTFCNMKNVLVEYINPLDASATNGYAIWQIYEATAGFKGVYAVGASKVCNQTYQLGNWGASTYAAYSTYADFQKANIDFSSWKGDFWTVIDGVPYPTKLADDFAKVNASISDTVKAGSSTVISGMNLRSKVVLSDAAKDLGVTVENNQLVVPSNVAVDTEIKFTVQSVFDSSKKVELSTKVTAAETKLKEITWTDFGLAYGTTVTGERSCSYAAGLNNTALEGDIVLAATGGFHYAGLNHYYGLTIQESDGKLNIGTTGGERLDGKQNVVYTCNPSDYGLTTFTNTRFKIRIELFELAADKSSAKLNIYINDKQVGTTMTYESINEVYNFTNNLGFGKNNLQDAGNVTVYAPKPKLKEITWTDFGLAYGTTVTGERSCNYAAGLNNTALEGDIVLAATGGFHYAGLNHYYGLTIQESDGKLNIGTTGGERLDGKQNVVYTCNASDYGLTTFTNTRFKIRIELFELAEDKSNAKLNIYINDKQVGTTMTYESISATYNFTNNLGFGKNNLQDAGNVTVYAPKPALKEITWTDFGLTNGLTVKGERSATYANSLNNTALVGVVSFASTGGFHYAGLNHYYGLTIQESDGKLNIGTTGGERLDGKQNVVYTCNASDYGLTTFTNTRFKIRIELFELAEDRSSAKLNIYINDKQVGTTMTYESTHSVYNFTNNLGFGQGNLNGAGDVTLYAPTEEIQKQLQTTSAVQNLSKRMQLVAKIK